MNTLGPPLRIFDLLLVTFSIFSPSYSHHHHKRHDYHTLPGGLKTIHKWKHIEFSYPNEESLKMAIKEGKYIPGNTLPEDVDAYYDDKGGRKIFMAASRSKDGIPATLGTIVENKHGRPVMEAYPSKEWHTDLHKCKRNRLVSVYRVKIDECDRLWAVDLGKIGDDNAPMVCTPQIVAFDLKTDTLVYQYDLPHHVFDNNSLLITTEVDVRKHRCEDAFIYVADCQAFSIIVHDVKQRKSWRIKDNSMVPDPSLSKFSILGDQWYEMDGTYGLALSPNEENRKLFFQAVTSDKENWIYTSDLNNQALWMKGKSSEGYRRIHTYRYKRDSQITAMAIDKNGIMYFSVLSDLSINCWNSYTEYSNKSIGVLDVNKKAFQYISGVKVVKNKAGEEELWILSTRYNKVATGTVDKNDYNFRIMSQKVSVLLQRHDNACQLSIS